MYVNDVILILNVGVIASLYVGSVSMCEWESVCVCVCSVSVWVSVGCLSVSVCVLTTWVCLTTPCPSLKYFEWQISHRHGRYRLTGRIQLFDLCSGFMEIYYCYAMWFHWDWKCVSYFLYFMIHYCDVKMYMYCVFVAYIWLLCSSCWLEYIFARMQKKQCDIYYILLYIHLIHKENMCKN